MNKLVRIGNSDLQTAPIGFGTMHFGVTVDKLQAHRLLDRYSEIPGAVLDTANIYSLGNSAGPFHEQGQYW